MIVLISPAKIQSRSTYSGLKSDLLFKKKTETLLNALKSLSKEEIQKQFKISDKLTKETYQNFQNYMEDSTALFTYKGEAYKSMDASSFSEMMLLNAQKHLRILSALYGLLQPFDKISLYRLDLMVKLDINLVDYWKETVTQALNEANQPLLNLASSEFISLIDLKSLKVPIYHIQFLNVYPDGSSKVVSAHAKKARGAFVRKYLEDPSQDFKRIVVDNYYFDHQENNEFIYIRSM